VQRRDIAAAGRPLARPDGSVSRTAKELTCLARRGAAVRIDPQTAFEPDALVYCASRLPPTAIEAPEPVIVVEVLSEGAAARDHGVKLEGYFSLPSPAHYLILDPEGRTAIDHQRGWGDVIETRILAEGAFSLDPARRGRALSAYVSALLPRLRRGRWREAPDGVWKAGMRR
jgi:Uma2 family endonuclease